MDKDWFRSRRRQFIASGAAGAITALAGCSQAIDKTRNRGTTTQQQTDLNSAEFSFTYHADSNQVTINYGSGGHIQGGDIAVRASTGTKATWAELGSTTADTNREIRPGANAILGKTIINWKEPVTRNETIRLVYTGQQTPATLGRFTPPSSSTLTSTVGLTTQREQTTTTGTTRTGTTTADNVTAPQIRAFSLTNPTAKQLRVAFDSDKRLTTISVRLDGSDTTTLTKSDFSVHQTTSSDYRYEASLSAVGTGRYSATLEHAIGPAGNDGATGSSRTVSIETTSNGPVARQSLLARWRLQNGFADSIDGHDATVVKGQPKTGTFDGRQATSFHGDVGTRVSRGNHGELSLMGRDDGPCTFSMWVYFDTESGGDPYKAGNTASHSLIRNDTGYVLAGRPAKNANGVDVRFHVRDVGSSAAQAYQMPDGDNAVVSTGSWHHLVVVADPTNYVRIYVDGKEKFTDDTNMTGFSAPNSDYWSDLTLGSWYGGNPAKWANLLNGKLADVRIYNTGLSAAQISQIYENGTTTSSNTNDLSAPITAQHGLAYHDGAVYGVTDGQIVTYDYSKGKITNRIPAPSNSRPRGLAYGNGSLWFADAIGPDYDGKIVELDPATGDVRSSIKSSWDPRGLAFGDGSLWVVDITTNRVVNYTPSGEQQGAFTTSGVTWGQGLAYANGSLWLGNNCSGDGCTVSLREYGTDGTLQQQIGRRSGSPTQPYGGLAVTGSKLLGPGADGTVTVLRTLD